MHTQYLKKNTKKYLKGTQCFTNFHMVYVLWVHSLFKDFFQIKMKSEIKIDYCSSVSFTSLSIFPTALDFADISPVALLTNFSLMLAEDPHRAAYNRQKATQFVVPRLFRNQCGIYIY